MRRESGSENLQAKEGFLYLLYQTRKQPGKGRRNECFEWWFCHKKIKEV